MCSSLSFGLLDVLPLVRDRDAGGAPVTINIAEVGWTDAAVETLRRGESAVVRPRGNSMAPRVRSGAICELEPVTDPDMLRGDVVLAKVKGTVYLHLITALEKERVQIGNNRGRINGWTPNSNVYGRLTRVDNTRTA